MFSQPVFSQPFRYIFAFLLQAAADDDTAAASNTLNNRHEAPQLPVANADVFTPGVARRELVAHADEVRRDLEHHAVAYAFLSKINPHFVAPQSDG